MAHCPYVTEEEGEMFAELGVAIAHCPMANSYFSSAVAPVQRFRKQGIHVGLGTDISGGYSPSMYENIRQAVLVSRLLETGVNAMLPPDERGGLGEGTRVSIVESFWLATTGGAEALGLPTGTFEPGRAFDMQVVDTERPDCRSLRALACSTPPLTVWRASCICRRPDNVRKVYAQGRLVCDKDARYARRGCGVTRMGVRLCGRDARSAA